MTRPFRLPVLWVALWCGCASEDPGALTVFFGPDTGQAVKAFFEPIPYEKLRLVESADPAAALASGRGGVRIAALADLDCGECYRIEADGARYRVRGGSALGVQYGLAHLLEELGFRFFHPSATHVPQTLAVVPSSPAFDRLHTPEQRLRGLHLHTLHPTEAYFDFWEPGDEHLAGARRVIDWTVKNRGNYLQWVALDDIQRPGGAEAWRAHTRQILDYAHARGITVGLGVQLFGKGNLQKAFDLIDDPAVADPRADVRARLSVVLEGLPFDRISLSFGEFSGVEPALFIQRLNLAAEVISELAPAAELCGIIHVGNYPDLQVDYGGKRQLFYFLVDYADPKIVPWVHTVMYFNLFEDAGGAYLHDEFADHRAYLLDRLRRGLRVGYQPESAYWVAFDNSIPTYLPLYLRSRWFDLAEVGRLSRAAGHAELAEHVLFTTGWEWGYWQTDAATLRIGFSLPERWDEPLEQMFAPWGEAGARVAAQVFALGELQHRFLLEGRLAAYLSGRDSIIDVGKVRGIVSQPDRPSFEEVAAMDPAARAAFRAKVLSPLGQLAEGTDGVREGLEASGADLEERWFAEVRDGVAADLARTRFVAALYGAAAAFGDKDQPGAVAQLALADAAWRDGREIVRRRHGRLHDSRAGQLTGSGKNATLYPFGYLREADTLCYWRRERIQTRRLVLGASEDEPACIEVDL
ncbi:MAG: hypothetical protein ACYC8T_01360 [Myxococcaceae bacterium]